MPPIKAKPLTAASKINRPTKPHNINHNLQAKMKSRIFHLGSFLYFRHNSQKSRIFSAKNVKNTNTQKNFVNLVIFFYSYYVDITSKKVYY